MQKDGHRANTAPRGINQSFSRCQEKRNAPKLNAPKHGACGEGGGEGTRGRGCLGARTRERRHHTQRHTFHCAANGSSFLNRFEDICCARPGMPDMALSRLTALLYSSPFFLISATLEVSFPMVQAGQLTRDSPTHASPSLLPAAAPVSP